MKGAKIRLYVDHPLGREQSVSLSRDQAHYLFGVMRLRIGDAVLVFNGVEGEWRAEIAEAGKRGGTLICYDQTAQQHNPPDVWLLFAPIKKARTDFIVEKATELGTACVQPVQTEFTNAERIRRDRLQAHAVEAAEQCGGTFVPPVRDIRKLDELLSAWPADRTLIFCDEETVLAGTRVAFDNSDDERDLTKAAILIGPEGGFSEAERAQLRKMALTLSLGPRILRADTAAVAALTLWQSHFGDWA